MNSYGDQAQIMPARTSCWDFPLELWRTIFEFLPHIGHLIPISATCSVFQNEAEALIYRHIELHKSAIILMLSSALESRPRRATIVRSLSIRRLDDAHVRVLNGVLRKLTALTSLHIQPRYDPELVLEGCSFQLVQFTTLFGPDSRPFHFFLATQRRLQDLDAGNLCRIFSAPRQGLLPHLRKLRASQDAIRQLNVDQFRHITHLGISVSTSTQVQNILQLFGPQLVSLSILKPNEDNRSKVVPALEPSSAPNLVFIEFVEKKLSVGWDFSQNLTVIELTFRYLGQDVNGSNAAG